MASTVSEWTAKALRPVARWVRMPDPSGQPRLMMVWEVLDPTPADVIGDPGALPRQAVGAERD
jgi:hypothetical protein